MLLFITYSIDQIPKNKISEILTFIVCQQRHNTENEMDLEEITPLKNEGKMNYTSNEGKTTI